LSAHLSDFYGISVNLEPLIICMVAGFTVQNYTWNCLAFDNTNQPAWADNNYTLHIVADTSPVISLVSPRNDSHTSSTTISFTCNLTDDNNAENFLNFELESIAKNAIWLAKKKYMQNIVWKDPDIHYDELSKISSKGFEIIQSSTPIFAREKLKELITYIFSVEKLNMKEFASLLKETKRQFRLTDVDKISFSKNVNNYQKYILNDTDELTFGTGNSKQSPHGIGAKAVREYKSALEIKKIATQTDEEYLLELGSDF